MVHAYLYDLLSAGKPKEAAELMPSLLQVHTLMCCTGLERENVQRVWIMSAPVLLPSRDKETNRLISRQRHMSVHRNV